MTGILKPNVDPHEYEPKPSDAVALSGAKLIVESGVGLDSWMGKLIDEAGGSAPVFVASQGSEDPPRRRRGAAGRPALVARPDELRAGGDHARLGARQGRRRRARDVREERRRYVGELEAMDAANMRTLRALPVAQRKLVTNHDAFGYFAAHYDITVLGSVLNSLSTSAQPSAQDIAALIEKIRAAHVKAIFTESSINPKLEQQIASEAGVKVYANLYGDTLGPPGSKGATYLQMERWNVTAIVDGLLGRPVPDDGAALRLGPDGRFGRRLALDRVSFDVRRARPWPSSARTAPARRPSSARCSARSSRASAASRRAERPRTCRRATTRSSTTP